MLSEMFEDAKDMLADIYLEDAEETYVCTVTNKQQALLFESRKDRPQAYKVVYRTKDGTPLCTQHFKLNK